MKHLKNLFSARFSGGAKKLSKKAWGKIFFIFLGILFLVGNFLWTPRFIFEPLSDLFDWRIRKVTIQNNLYTPDAMILKALNVADKPLLFTPSLKTFTQNLEHLPWIKGVSFRRQIPSQLFVYIEEYHPVAILQTPKGYRLVDKEQHVLEVQPKDLELYRGLPMLVGKKTLEAFFGQLSQSLEKYPQIAVHIQTAEFIRGHLWLLTTYTKTHILLPPLDINHALQNLQDVQNHYNILGGNVIEIDLRVPGRFFMTPESLPRRIRYRQRKLAEKK